MLVPPLGLGVCVAIGQTKAGQGGWCDRCKRPCLATGSPYVRDISGNCLGTSCLGGDVMQSSLGAGGRFPSTGAPIRHVAARGVGCRSALPCCSLRGPGWEALAALSTWSTGARVAGVLPGRLLVETIA